MSNNIDRRARISAAIDRAFGETTCILRFVSAGQMKGYVPDLSRQPLTVQAKFFDATVIEKPDATKTGRKRFLTDVIGSAERATIALSAFTSPADWPVPGDRLQRMDLPGQPVIEVATAMPDQTGRLGMMLGRITA